MSDDDKTATKPKNKGGRPKGEGRPRGAWSKPVYIDGTSDYLVGTHRFARLYGRNEHWARNLLQEWYTEQLKGGPVRVLVRYTIVKGKRQRRLFTTIGVIEQSMPRGRDMELERWRKEVDADIDRAFRRIVELELRLGIRKMGTR